MATREQELNDAIGEAIAYTEKEIFDYGMKGRESDDSGPLDPTGDRSLETQGEGLEGQHESPDEDESEAEPDEDEESEGEETEEGDQGEDSEEGEDDAEEAEGEEAEDAEGEEPQAAQPDAKPETKPEGRVPSGRLREQTERAERAERELQTQREQAQRDIAELRAQMTGLMTALQGRAPQAPQVASPPTPQPDQPPDLFENPQGFVEYIGRGREADRAQFGALLNQMRVENSLAIAHAIHKEDFARAFEAANKLPPNTPETRDTVQRIFTSPNPGEALVQWHKRVERDQRLGNESLDDHDRRVAQETRDALVKDPEFRKAFMAELRSEAAGETGKPARTITRLPKSLNGAAGSSAERSRIDPLAGDDSDRAVFDSAWR